MGLSPWTPESGPGKPIQLYTHVPRFHRFLSKQVWTCISCDISVHLVSAQTLRPETANELTDMTPY